MCAPSDGLASVTWAITVTRDPLLQYAFWKRTCKSTQNVSVQTWFSTRILLCFLSLNRFNLSSLKEKQNPLLIFGQVSLVATFRPHFQKMLLVKTGMWRSFASGIWNPGLWNPESSSRNFTNDSTPESKFHWQRIQNPRLGIQNGFSYMGRYILKPCRMSHAILVNLCRSRRET